MATQNLFRKSYHGPANDPGSSAHSKIVNERYAAARVKNERAHTDRGTFVDRRQVASGVWNSLLSHPPKGLLLNSRQVLIDSSFVSAGFRQRCGQGRAISRPCFSCDSSPDQRLQNKE
jgi:hypothetical protein